MYNVQSATNAAEQNVGQELLDPFSTFENGLLHGSYVYCPLMTSRLSCIIQLNLVTLPEVQVWYNPYTSSQERQGRLCCRVQRKSAQAS